MRVLVRAMIPTAAGNKMVKDHNFIKNLEDYIKKFNCEASYFLEVNGNWTMVFVLDLPSPDMIPAVVEPIFQAHDANVEIHPAMNLDDLKKAISRMQQYQYIIEFLHKTSIFVKLSSKYFYFL